MNKRNELFEALMSMDEDYKSTLIARVFGRFEAVEQRENNHYLKSESFFKVAKLVVEEYEEKQKKKQQLSQATAKHPNK